MRHWSRVFRPCSRGPLSTRRILSWRGVCTAGRTLVLRTGALPVPMQREISWWVATCHADGERVINTCDWNRWVATAVR